MVDSRRSDDPDELDDLEQLLIERVPAEVPSSSRPVALARLRLAHRQKLGDLLAKVLLANVCVVTLLVFVLGVRGDSPEKIYGTVAALEPFLLPPLGVLVGFCLPRGDEH